jgi:hypothetical protein
MIAHRRTPLQPSRGWQAPDQRVPAISRAELTTARWLGLVVAVAVAAGVVAIVGILQPTSAPLEGTNGFAVGAAGIVPVLAAAPFGWLLGPAAAKARPLGAAGIVVAMAIGVMILGDILTVLAIVLGSVVASGTSNSLVDIGAGFVVLSLVGAVIVGPVVVALLTLPASVVWIVAFRVAWTRVRPDGPD